MNERFQTLLHCGIPLLVYRPWWSQGIVHGMTMGEIDLRASRLPNAERELCAAIGLSYLALPEQVHGCEYSDLRTAPAVAAVLARQGSLIKGARCDAFIAPSSQTLKGSRIGFGVMSADCVPVLVRAQTGWAAIHAGWRGLASGVIARAIGALDGVEEAAVFAAAGGLRYQVGPEVIEAIGSTAVCTKTADGRYLLDTAQTAIRQLRVISPAIKAEAAGICTISDERFHSFRRQGEGCGRSVTFIIPPD